MKRVPPRRGVTFRGGGPRFVVAAKTAGRDEARPSTTPPDATKRVPPQPAGRDGTRPSTTRRNLPRWSRRVCRFRPAGPGLPAAAGSARAAASRKGGRNRKRCAAYQSRKITVPLRRRGEIDQECPSAGLDVPRYVRGSVRGSGARLPCAGAGREAPLRRAGGRFDAQPGAKWLFPGRSPAGGGQGPPRGRSWLLRRKSRRAAGISGAGRASRPPCRRLRHHPTRRPFPTGESAPAGGSVPAGGSFPGRGPQAAGSGDTIPNCPSPSSSSASAPASLGPVPCPTSR